MIKLRRTVSLLLVLLLFASQLPSVAGVSEEPLAVLNKLVG